MNESHKPQYNPETKHPTGRLRRVAATAMTGLALFGVYKAGGEFVSHVRQLESHPIEFGNEDNTHHTVKAGENPWTIARGILGEDADVRHLVNGIKEQAGENGVFMPGQVIELPPQKVLEEMKSSAE